MAQAVRAMVGSASMHVRGGGSSPAASSSISPTESAGCGLALRSRATKVSLLRNSSGVVVRRRRAYGDLLLSKAAAILDSLNDGDAVKDQDSEYMEEAGLSQRELKDYPPGFRRYETMAVLRPDISEDERLALTQRYEEAIVAGGGLDVEMFNRGIQPLAYSIKTRNLSGLSNRYLDGIYLLFTYATKPETQASLQKRLNTDDDVIRSMSFKLKT